MSESADSLVEQILEDARNQAERKKKKARRRADNILSEARSEAEEERQRILDEADSRAEAKEKRLRAGITQEKRFMRQKALQNLLEHVRQQSMTRLAGFRGQEDYMDILLNLAVEALEQMQGQCFVLFLPTEERDELGEELVEAVCQKAKKDLNRDVELHLGDETVDASGGLRLMRKDGAEICDETFEARMERLWPEVRHEVADIIRSSDAWRQSTSANRGSE